VAGGEALPSLRFPSDFLFDHLVLELDEDERGFRDVAGPARAGGDILQGGPALGEQRKAAFAVAAHRPDKALRVQMSRCCRRGSSMTAASGYRNARWSSGHGTKPGNPAFTGHAARARTRRIVAAICALPMSMPHTRSRYNGSSVTSSIRPSPSVLDGQRRAALACNGGTARGAGSVGRNQPACSKRQLTAPWVSGSRRQADRRPHAAATGKTTSRAVPPAIFRRDGAARSGIGG
jgi:hypothetical protein